MQYTNTTDKPIVLPGPAITIQPQEIVELTKRQTGNPKALSAIKKGDLIISNA